IYSRAIDNYNKAHGSNYSSYMDIDLPRRVPSTNSLEREDWIKFVRNEMKLSYVRLDDSLQESFRKFIADNYQTIEAFNKSRSTNFLNFAEIPFPKKVDDAIWLSVDFEYFVKSEQYCPAESLSICGPDQEFEDYIIAKYGKLPKDYPRFGAIQAATDFQDCMKDPIAIKWEFTKRNYIQVLDYIAMHGNGLINTFIYCSLAIATALIVNPMAAYALSRFNLPSTYKILLFFMSTMAFPGEVAMIPNFLMMKRFPLFPILTGIVVTLLVFKISEKLASSIKETHRALFSLFLGLVSGALILPRLAPEFATVSLLNTFAALVLPGMANGYSIFLLKGFFDSMPRELYEAAEIDGAGEWTKFWVLTMNLSKPILAVIALGAFTHAYSAFMMALVIVPDQKMWTIMVWIYQLQAQSPQPVVYASLVIAAIPTFTIFVLCQNVIMRGIVVPTEK
ncbi:MAG TPA: carbohydrate ABC transporter permease, partial [Victivallales bacterium]|nr:carbohydrate ABC transporter permease [Victivallales bacterium]